MNRKEMLQYLYTVSLPVLEAGSQGKLRKSMWIEQQHEELHRERCSVLEGVGRLICGIAPWLEAETSDPEEQAMQASLSEMARNMIAHQVNPESPDYACFNTEIPEVAQILVDMAFLAQGMLRAPHALIDNMPEPVIQQVLEAMIRSREILPYDCNWILFSSMVEAFIYKITRSCDPLRISYGFRQFEQWYSGDGMYGDGPDFAMDYYNSYVIQPMLLELVSMFPDIAGETVCKKIRERAVRYGQIQERMIAPDGTFIVIGRSICYRCGAFHHLAALALYHMLPDTLSPGQVRAALSAVIEKTLTPASYREDGFLRIGICGSQPSLGEDYISTGSLYLCAFAFLVLGLSDTDPFWTDPEEDWTQKKIWKGVDVLRDHKI